jgi:hypothetical protein
MLRADGTSFRVCKGCGTIPIENPKTGLFVCPLCTGPVSYIGSGPNDLELIPPIRKTMVAPVVIEMPYAFKLLSQEMETYLNIGMRIMTEKDLLRLDGINKEDLPPPTEEEKSRFITSLPVRALPESVVPQFREIVEGPTEASPELLMKLGAIAPTPRVSSSEDVVLDGTGVQGAIQAAANVAASSINKPGVVPGTMIQTSQGPMFQPNPTTVTVVPPARSIQVVGQPEELVADEDLSAETGEGIPQVLPLAQGQAPMGQAQQQQGGYMAPMMQMGTMAPMGQMMQMGPMNPMGQMMQMPQIQMSGGGQQYNMSPYPAVYAASQPQPAQLFTSGVPGAPPTIAVDTGAMQMGGFLMPSMQGAAPRPMRNNTTQKKSSGGASSEKTSDPNMRITVIKGS